MASEAAAFVLLLVAIWEHINNKSVSAFVLLGFVVMLAWAGSIVAWNKTAKQLELIEEAKPKIQLKLPGAVHTIPVSQGVNVKTVDGKDVQVVINAPFLRVRFWNDPASSYPKTFAKGVRAYVKFIPTGQGISTLEIAGRWSESNQPRADDPYTSTAPLAETTFSLGESKILDIAYISAIDGKCYAWNNDNYKYPFYQNPDHLLTNLGYTVDIRIRGERIDEHFQFTFWVNKTKFSFQQPLEVSSEKT